MGIDFKEIPPSNQKGSNQDTWEFFAEDFLMKMGYQIIQGPSRGRDGGVDLIIQEESNQKPIKWLVSCKHNANSGKSVTKADETDLLDRLARFECNGFMTVYSTIANSSLSEYFSTVRNKGYLLKEFDSGKIAKHILGNPIMDTTFCHYFPKSYKNWKENFGTPEPVNLVRNWIKKEGFFDPDLIERIFGSIGSFIKCVRLNFSFEEAIKESDLEFIQVYEVYDYKSSESLRNCAQFLLEKGVPNRLNNNWIYTGMGSHPKELWVLTDEYYICTPEYLKRLEKMYSNLKPLIN